MYFLGLFVYFLAVKDILVLPLLVVVLTTLITNWLLSVKSHRILLSLKPSLKLELVLHMLALATFLYFSGGVSLPLISFLLPYVAIGATILSTRQAWKLGLLAVLVYSLLWKSYQDQTIYEYQLTMHHYAWGAWITFTISVVVFIWFITRMTAVMRKCNNDLIAANEKTKRDKWIVTLGGLAAGTAHELSTPLSTLCTLVEELRASQDPVIVCRADLELMEAQLMVCRKALTRLTIQAGCPCVEGEDNCAADEWLRRLVHAWQNLHPNAEISITLDPSLSRICLVPDISLEQAIRNLVDNGAAAHPEGVKLSARCSDNFLEIQVTDRGPGIHHVSLRELEQGLPQKSKRGLGLGLALAKSTVERYGGRMEFSNLPQGGAKARLLLPLDEVCAT